MRSWSILCGHIVHDDRKPHYLSSRYEAELCEIVTQAEISHRSMIKDEVLDRVMVFLSRSQPSDFK
jgi:hypothetical protein